MLSKANWWNTHTKLPGAWQPYSTGTTANSRQASGAGPGLLWLDPPARPHPRGAWIFRSGLRWQVRDTPEPSSTRVCPSVARQLPTSSSPRASNTSTPRRLSDASRATMDFVRRPRNSPTPLASPPSPATHDARLTATQTVVAPPEPRLPHSGRVPERRRRQGPREAPPSLRARVRPPPRTSFPPGSLCSSPSPGPSPGSRSPSTKPPSPLSPHRH